MLNWGAFAGKCAKTDFQLGKDIMSTTSNYLTSLSRQSQLESQGKDLVKQEESLRESQTYYEKQAGRDQEQGRQEREQIGLAGGQAVSQVTTSAAGSGIDTSSAMVKKAIGDIRTQIMNNYASSAQNEQQQATQSMTNAINANQQANAVKISKIWNDYSVDMEKSNRKIGVITGIAETAGNFIQGMGEAMGSLMGGG